MLTMSDILLADKRRMKIVELGGAKGLVNMLAGAKDDKTRKHALKALVAISKSGQSVYSVLSFFPAINKDMVIIRQLLDRMNFLALFAVIVRP